MQAATKQTLLAICTVQIFLALRGKCKAKNFSIDMMTRSQEE